MQSNFIFILHSRKKTFVNSFFFWTWVECLSNQLLSNCPFNFFFSKSFAIIYFYIINCRHFFYFSRYKRVRFYQFNYRRWEFLWWKICFMYNYNILICDFLVLHKVSLAMFNNGRFRLIPLTLSSWITLKKFYCYRGFC